MPLLVPQLPKIQNLKTLLGKKVLDESLIPDPKNKNDSVENVIWKSQLPSNVVLIKADVERTAITGAVKSGLVPIIVNENDIVLHVY
jgi:hypothetical protein